MILYELDGRDGRRFSPYCWRTDMALRHKGLEAEHVAVGFADKSNLDFTDYKKVPVLRDGDQTITDSWNIAVYLDEAYADRPALMAGPEARGLAPIIVADILDDVAECGSDHFRTTRESRFGCRLEDVCGDLEQRIDTFRKALTPARLTLSEQPFLSGGQAGYADYILFGSFQWASITSDVALLESEDPVSAWRERLSDLFGGYGRKTGR